MKDLGVTTSTGELAAQAAYDRDACSYDSRTATYQKYRRETVDRLPVRRGDVVLDVGCGTGLCFGLVRDKIGSSGRVIGIDESPQMIELAAERAGEREWDNVTLVESAVQDAEIPVTADAALFCATHDSPVPAGAGERVRPPATRGPGRCQWRQVGADVEGRAQPLFAVGPRALRQVVRGVRPTVGPAQ